MRTPERIISLILSVAEEDQNIRAVLLTGSRANPDCPVDIYQDFDICFFVNDVRPYWDNERWIEEKFGKPSLLQKPESMSLIPPDNNGNYVYLMLFPDGNRIDLQITSAAYNSDGEPAKLLLDKDGDFPVIEVKKDFWYIKKPDQKAFSDCCNEFHWCLNNVVKGIARDELPYVMDMLNHYVRDMLVLMLEWYIGANNNFSVPAGKNGKYFKKLLPEDIYKRYAETYPDAVYGHIWQAAFGMLGLFSDVAGNVAEKLMFTYDKAEEKGIKDYMEQVKNNILEYNEN